MACAIRGLGDHEAREFGFGRGRASGQQQRGTQYRTLGTELQIMGIDEYAIGCPKGIEAAPEATPGPG